MTGILFGLRFVEALRIFKNFVKSYQFLIPVILSWFVGMKQQVEIFIEFMIFFQTIVARMLIAGRWRTSASKLCKRLLGGGGRE